MNVHASLSRVDLRSARSAAQATIAALGALIILGSTLVFGLIFAVMSRSESGFAEGLALIVGGFWILVGFIVLSVGLWIPQREGEGIRLSRIQRTCFLYGVLAPVIAILSIPIGARLLPPLEADAISILVTGLALLIISGPLATVVGIGLKLRNNWATR